MNFVSKWLCLCFLLSFIYYSQGAKDNFKVGRNVSLASRLSTALKQRSNEYVNELSSYGASFFEGNVGQVKSILRRRNEEHNTIIKGLQQIEIFPKDKSGGLDVLAFFKLLDQIFHLFWDITIAELSAILEVLGLAKVQDIHLNEIVQPLQLLPRAFSVFAKQTKLDVEDRIFETILQTINGPKSIFQVALDSLRRAYNEPFDALAELIIPATKVFQPVAIVITDKSKDFLAVAVEAYESSARSFIKVLPKFLEVFGDDADLIHPPMRSVIVYTVLFGKASVRLIGELSKYVTGKPHFCKPALVDLGKITLNILQNGIPVTIKIVHVVISFFEKYVRSIYRILYDFAAVLLHPYAPDVTVIERSAVPIVKNIVATRGRFVPGIDHNVADNLDYKKTMKAFYDTTANLIGKHKNKTLESVEGFSECVAGVDFDDSNNSLLDQYLNGNYVGARMVGSGKKFLIEDALEAVFDPYGILNLFEGVSLRVQQCSKKVVKTI